MLSQFTFWERRGRAGAAGLAMHPVFSRCDGGTPASQGDYFWPVVSLDVAVPAAVVLPAQSIWIGNRAGGMSPKRKPGAIMSRRDLGAGSPHGPFWRHCV